MLEINLTFYYLIKLFGHSGSSTITIKHAFDPRDATAEPTKDRIDAIKVILSLLFFLCLNFNLNHNFLYILCSYCMAF